MQAPRPRSCLCSLHAGAQAHAPVSRVYIKIGSLRSGTFVRSQIKKRAFYLLALNVQHNFDALAPQPGLEPGTL